MNGFYMLPEYNTPSVPVDHSHWGLFEHQAKSEHIWDSWVLHPPVVPPTTPDVIQITLWELLSETGGRSFPGSFTGACPSADVGSPSADVGLLQSM